MNELDIAGHTISETKRKGALLRDLPSEFDVTVESIMLAGPSYQEEISMFVVRDMRLEEADKFIKNGNDSTETRNEKLSSVLHLWEARAYRKGL